MATVTPRFAARAPHATEPASIPTLKSATSHATVAALAPSSVLSIVG